MAKNSIFELNGKAYDALTGAMLGDAKRATAPAHVQYMQPKPQPRRQVSGVSIDGMVGSGTNRQQRRPSVPQHVAAHQPQPTKTLMRHAVKAPAPGQLHPQTALRAAKASNNLQAHGALRPAGTMAVIAPKLSSHVVDPRRAHRATATNRSQAVQHFSPGLESRRRNFAQAPALSPAAKPAAPAASSTANQDDSYEQDLFEQALAHATSHQQTLDSNLKIGSTKSSRRRRRQAWGIVGSLSVFLLLFVVIAYQNRSTIQLQLASAKAGFSASVPLYKPAGYTLGKLAYSPGNVAAIYQHDGNQSFTVTQKKSNWDSQTLLENFVATSNQDYNGYQSNGRTVYVYGKGNATWVNAGIWYQIKDPSGNLSNEQLVKIAASI